MKSKRCFPIIANLENPFLYANMFLIHHFGDKTRNYAEERNTSLLFRQCNIFLEGRCRGVIVCFMFMQVCRLLEMGCCSWYWFLIVTVKWQLFFIEYKSEYLRSINPLYESVDDYVCIAEKYVYMTNVTNAICGILGLTTHHICSYFWYTR